MGAKTTLGHLAEMVGGTLIGDGTAAIEGAKTLAEAGPGHVTFMEDAKYARHLNQCHATALITRKNQSHNGIPNVIEVDDPLSAFLQVFKHLHSLPEPDPHGIDSRAYVHPTAKLGANVSLYPFVCIGEGSVIGDDCRLYAGVSIGRHCRIGENVVLHPNVVVYDGCSLGDRVIIHANAVIGADGFGYRMQGGRHVKIPQLSSVEIGDDVELGACTTIDRGAFQPTRVGEGTKMDNHVQIGHNCRIGRHNVIVSQVGIGGSSSTGDYVTIAGQAGIVDHAHIGERAIVGAQAGVTHDIPAGERVLGAPARPERDLKIMLLTLERLPEIRKDVKAIKQKLGMN